MHLTINSPEAGSDVPDVIINTCNLFIKVHVKTRPVKDELATKES